MLLSAALVAFALWTAQEIAETSTLERSVPVVDVVRLDGVVGPAMARYVRRSLNRVVREKAQILVIEIDTPGGLMKSMGDITKAMLNSPAPTAIYVYPRGGRAASAGVFITYAANVAAMAPATHIGAAHPVAISGFGAGGGVDKTEMTKLTNDAVAEIRGLAIRRGRNAAWAEQAVRQSVSITDEQALRLHVVDLIADSPRALLAKIDGRNVRTVAGSRRLATANARVVEIPMDVAEQFLLLLSDPNVGVVLMTIAMYGLIFELNNPGSVFPGVLGGLALILAFASFAVVEVNVAGLLLIGFSMILFIADIKVPTHGVLTAGGLASFILGAVLLTEYQASFLKISLILIVTLAALTAAFFTFVVGAGLRAQRRKVGTGREGLVDAVGVARSDLAPTGTVFLQGALWSAEAVAGAIAAGRPVRVVRTHGLRLNVREATETQTEEGMA
jgi:membrane-bound serine protease (ClpP class)